jgi:hypothetical protein
MPLVRPPIGLRLFAALAAGDVARLHETSDTGSDQGLLSAQRVDGRDACRTVGRHTARQEGGRAE